MKRFVRSFAALVLVGAAVPAMAFTRETTTPGNPATGLCLWWRTRQVTYAINATSATTSASSQTPRTPCDSTSAAEQAAVAGMTSWNTASTSCSDFTFVQGAATTRKAIGADGVNLIVFRSGRCVDVPCSGPKGTCSSQYNCWEYDNTTLGLTTTSFNSDTGEITDADMELFAWDGSTPPYGAYFTCSDATAPRCSYPYGTTPPTEPCYYNDVQAIVGHEAGHMLGLDHVCSSNPADPPMFRACAGGSPIMKPTVGDVSQRVLATDDVSGVCTIYPKGAATVTCASTNPPPEKSGGGCSTAGGSGVIALLGAALALGRRRTA